MAQDGPDYPWWKPGEWITADLEGALHIPGIAAFQGLGGGPAQDLHLAVEGVGRACQHRIDAGADVAQRRQHAEANAVAVGRRQGVGGVFAVLEPGGRMVADDVFAANPQQRSDDVPGNRPHGPQATQAAAANQSQEYGFGLVVTVVGDGHAAGAGLAPNGVEVPVTKQSGSLLDAQAFFTGKTGDVGRHGMEGYAGPGSEFADKVAVGAAVGSQLVIEVGNLES